MELFYSDKDICMRLRVSYDNQERLKPHIARYFAPLFTLKRDQFFNVRFEYKTFTCTYQGKKQEFSYKDIKKIETITDGLILYLNNDKLLQEDHKFFDKRQPTNLPPLLMMNKAKMYELVFLQ